MILKKVIIFFTLIFLFNTLSHTAENKIVLKINNEIITSVDVFNEIKYLSILIKDFNNFEKKNLSNIIKFFIRQKVKEIELSKNFKKLIIDDKILDPQIKSFMRKLNFNSNIDFEEYLNSKNIEIDEVRKKLSYELLWNKLIYEKFNKNIKIDKQKIEKSLKENTTQYEYLFLRFCLMWKIKKN